MSHREKLPRTEVEGSKWLEEEEGSATRSEVEEEKGERSNRGLKLKEELEKLKSSVSKPSVLAVSLQQLKGAEVESELA